MLYNDTKGGNIVADNLNKPDHILNKIINSTNELLSLQVFYINHYKKPDKKYTSYEISLSNQLMTWFKGSIKKELKNLKKKTEADENPKFQFHKYNDEFDKRDSLSVIDVDEKGDPLKKTLKDLIESTVNNTGIIKNASFSLVKVGLGDLSCFFGYYRGLKKSGSKKKYCLGKIETDDYFELTQPMIEIGGTPSFIIYKNFIYVVNPRYFEYAFKYSDHITKKRDENLSRIINMDFFEDPIAKDNFYEKSKHHLRARSIAQIPEDTFVVLEENFSERCSELKEIEQGIEDDPSILADLQENSQIILDLIDCIDLENEKIIFNEDSDPTPLLHLFQDKIMESFLTKDIRIAISI